MRRICSTASTMARNAIERQFARQEDIVRPLLDFCGFARGEKALLRLTHCPRGEGQRSPCLPFAAAEIFYCGIELVGDGSSPVILLLALALLARSGALASRFLLGTLGRSPLQIWIFAVSPGAKKHYSA